MASVVSTPVATVRPGLGRCNRPTRAKKAPRARAAPHISASSYTRVLALRKRKTEPSPTSTTSAPDSTASSRLTSADTANHVADSPTEEAGEDERHHEGNNSDSAVSRPSKRCVKMSTGIRSRAGKGP